MRFPWTELREQILDLRYQIGNAPGRYNYVGNLEDRLAELETVVRLLEEYLKIERYEKQEGFRLK